MDKFSRQAYEFVSGPIAPQGLRHPTRSDPRLRDAYGRHLWGQSTLLARRLVEGRLDLCHDDVCRLDHHTDLKAGMQTFLPIVDSAVATLFRDLDERGLLETTPGGAVRRVQPDAEDE